jgi:DNA-binding transcriptional LysR family regulator
VFDGVESTVAVMVKAGQVDFGISSQTYGDRELTSHLLNMDRLCAVVAPDHALAKKHSMTLHELARHPLILMLKDSSSRQIVDLAFNREGLVSNVAYETTYGTTVAGLAQAGLGVGILPESMVGPIPLHQLQIRGGALTRRISIIVRAGRSLSPTAGKLRQTLETLVQPVGPRRGSGRKRT